MPPDPPPSNPRRGEAAAVSETLSRDQYLVARKLATDAATVELVEILKRRGSETLLLKGPAIADWLYDPGDGRSYVDMDLFIRLDDRQKTRDVLLDLGYSEIVLYRDPLANRQWTRKRDGALVDLHVSLWGSGVDVQRQWRVLSSSAEKINLGAAEVSIPRPAVRACLVSLHAAKHGRGWPKPMEDLRRAIDRLGFADWEKALEVATELDAVEAFSAGLRLSAEGTALASRLDVPPPSSKELFLRAETDPHDLLGMFALFGRRGLGVKLRFVVDRLFPTPAFMRHYYAIARGGRLGLAAVYLLRPFDLVRRMIRTLWRQRVIGNRLTR